MIIIETGDGFVFLKNINPEQAAEILGSFDGRDLRNIGSAARYDSGNPGGSRHGGTYRSTGGGICRGGGCYGDGTGGGNSARHGGTDRGSGAGGNKGGNCGGAYGIGGTGGNGGSTGSCCNSGSPGGIISAGGGKTAGAAAMPQSAPESPDGFICGIFVPVRGIGTEYPEGSDCGGGNSWGGGSLGGHPGSANPGAAIPEEIAKISAPVIEPGKPPHKPAGLISGTLYGNTLWIRMLAVVPAFRRKGIGGRASEILLEYCRNKCGISCAALSVAGENRAGIRFWEKQGFTDAGRLYKPLYGEDRMHAVIIMKKDLHICM